MKKYNNSSLFSSDGRVRCGMGLSRVRQQDKRKWEEEQRKQERRFNRLAETAVRFLLRAEFKYAAAL